MQCMSRPERSAHCGSSSLRSVLVLSALTVMPLMIGACCPAARPDLLPDSAYPGELRPPAELGRDIVWRQRVTAKWGKSQSRSFEAVLQKQGGKLTLLGLSPMGQMGFAITLENGEITFENKSGRDLPFPPRFIILDVQRVFWPWLGSPPKGGSGERSGTAPGELVTETWANGRLQERTFTRSSKAEDEPKGTIRVAYQGYRPGDEVPPRAVLNNGWFNYVLVVETYEQDSL